MNQPTLLLVANYDSGVGYAWWLMESYWVRLAQAYAPSHGVMLAYPSISKLPASIAAAPLRPEVCDFSGTDPASVLRQAKFVMATKVKTVYFTDQSVLHWRYLVLRLAGVRTIIVHDHTPGMRARPSGLKRLLKRFIYGLPWVTGDAVIGATDFVRMRHIESTGDTGRRQLRLTRHRQCPDDEAGREDLDRARATNGSDHDHILRCEI